MDKFVLHSEFKPTGDQPQAIEQFSGRKSMPDFTWSDRIRKNIYDGKCHCKNK